MGATIMTYARHNPYDLDADELHPDGDHWSVCACCGETMHRSESANPDDWQHVEAMEAEHGGPVCTTCAEDWGFCERCDRLTAERTATLHDGWVCEDCAAELPEAIAERAAEEAADLAREGV